VPTIPFVSWEFTESIFRMGVYLGRREQVKKCRVCTRVMRPRTNARASKVCPEVCTICAQLTYALHGKWPTMKGAN